MNDSLVRIFDPRCIGLDCYGGTTKDANNQDQINPTNAYMLVYRRSSVLKQEIEMKRNNIKEEIGSIRLKRELSIDNITHLKLARLLHHSHIEFICKLYTQITIPMLLERTSSSGSIRPT